jgi:phosphoglycerol geranylgeranyltransferase
MSFEKLKRKLESGKKARLAVLIDPDKFNPELVRLAGAMKVSCFLVGGSKLEKGNIQTTVKAIKRISTLPVILFPGDETQLTKDADGLLLLSLLSGRNPDYLIEKHIAAAPSIKKMKLQYLSTAYLLIGGGKKSTTQSVTKTAPLDPADKKYIINTALAAQQLGFKALYLEAGSGATSTISADLLSKIKKEISIPVIVGGGIDSGEKTKVLIKAGANMIVVGNALEKNVYLLAEISSCF